MSSQTSTFGRVSLELKRARLNRIHHEITKLRSIRKGFRAQGKARVAADDLPLVNAIADLLLVDIDLPSTTERREAIKTAQSALDVWRWEHESGFTA